MVWRSQWRSLEQHVLRARLIKGGGLASAPVRMGGAGASGAYSLASSIVSLVFFIVSFVFISFIVIMSLRTVTTSVVDGMHSVWAMHGDREQRRWRAQCSACACQMCQRPAGRRSASGQ